PYLLRGELAGVSSHRRTAGRVIACFEQLTDVHVMDVQSPARVEFFDPYGSIPGLSDFKSAHRPQELLSAQVGDAMVRQLRPIQAAGVGLPWYAAYGNHDGLVQGNVPRSALFQQLATGPFKLTGLPPSILQAPLGTQVQFLVGLLQQDPTAINLELSQGSHR